MKTQNQSVARTQSYPRCGLAHIRDTDFYYKVEFRILNKFTKKASEFIITFLQYKLYLNRLKCTNNEQAALRQYFRCVKRTFAPALLFVKYCYIKFLSFFMCLNAFRVQAMPMRLQFTRSKKQLASQKFLGFWQTLNKPLLRL